MYISLPQRILIALCIISLHFVVIGLIYNNLIKVSPNEQTTKSLISKASFHVASFLQTKGTSKKQLDQIKQNTSLTKDQAALTPLKNEALKDQKKEQNPPLTNLKTSLAQSKNETTENPLIDHNKEQNTLLIDPKTTLAKSKNEAVKKTIKDQKHEKELEKSTIIKVKKETHTVSNKQNKNNAVSSVGANINNNINKEVASTSQVQGVSSSNNVGVNNGNIAQAVYVDLNRAKMLSKPKLQYPQQARRFGQEGTVILDLHVNEKGSVIDLTMHQSSRYNLLDQAAKDFARKIKFAPYIIDHKPQPIIVRLPILFKLK